jgi:small multidrug resistance family-3 protein
MKVFLFILAATVCESFGDAIMRVGLKYNATMGRLALLAGATVLLGMYGALLNLAPVEFAEATGIYIACLFVMFQVTNYLFFRAVPTPGIWLGGSLIMAGATIVYLWR